MSDHFPIVIDVEEKAVGSVLRLLNSTPGILTIHLQLAAASATAAKQLAPAKSIDRLASPSRSERFAKRAQSRIQTGSLRILIAEALSKSPLHLNVLREILERGGYSNMSLHSCITKMLMQKFIQRTAPGTYKLTQKGDRAYLKKNAALNRNGHLKRIPDNSNGVRGFVLRQLAKNSLSQDDLRETLVAAGYSAANMYNSVKLLREESLIRKEDNIYSITDRGREAIVEDTSPIIGEVMENEQHIGDTA